MSVRHLVANFLFLLQPSTHGFTLPGRFLSTPLRTRSLSRASPWPCYMPQDSTTRIMRQRRPSHPRYQAQSQQCLRPWKVQCPRLAHSPFARVNATTNRLTDADHPNPGVIGQHQQCAPSPCALPRVELCRGGLLSPASRLDTSGASAIEGAAPTTGAFPSHSCQRDRKSSSRCGSPKPKCHRPTPAVRAIALCPAPRRALP